MALSLRQQLQKKGTIVSIGVGDALSAMLAERPASNACTCQAMPPPCWAIPMSAW